MKKQTFVRWSVFLWVMVMMHMGVAGPLLAEETGPDNPPGNYMLEDVVVRGDLSQKNLEASGSKVLSHEEITNRVYESPIEILGQVPGVSINQYKQGGTAASMQMRGFRSISHGSDAAFYIDGIPMNEGDGYADTNIVNPEELERVEVIKGPVSPLYGNYASAGVIHFHTMNHVDHQHMKLLYGADNTYEANYVGGLTSEDGKTDHVYSIMAYHTDGYQDNSEWDKLNGAARLTHHMTDDLNIRLSVRGFNSDWDAPGWINQEEYENAPKTCVNEANGGSKDYKSGKVDVDYMLSNDSKLLFQVWSYDQNFVRNYAGRDEGIAEGTNIGNVRDFDRLAYGSNVSYNFLGNPLGRKLSFTAGADYMMEDIDRQRWRLTAGNGREKGDKYIDYHIDFESIGIYTDIKYQIIEPLQVIVGGRYDMFSGDLTDHLLGDLDSSMEDTEIFSPKGGLLLTLMDSRLEFFTNYARGFAMMSGFAEQAQYTQDNWDPQIRTQYELGMRIRPVDWFKAQVVGFRLDTTDDFILDPVTDEYENAGETTRKGLELTLDFYALDYGYLHCDYSYIDATYDTYSSGGVSYDGNDLRGVPDSIANIELGYAPDKGLGGWIRYHYQSGAMLDDANTRKGESWDKFDANVFYRFGNTRNYMVALAILNIFDEKYPASQSGTNYSPGLPLSAYLSFAVDF